MKKAFFIGIFLAVLGFSSLSNAALINNGNGLIYDTDLNITWYDAPAVSRTWYESMTWTAGLTIGGTVAGSWRLPTTPGITVSAYTSEGEMGHLYYVELGKSAGGLLGTTSPFTNLQPALYWYGTEFGSSAAWDFDFGNTGFGGGQTGDFKDRPDIYMLAVHSGNIGPNGPISSVPIPGAILLFAPSLAGIAVLRGRLKK